MSCDDHGARVWWTKGEVAERARLSPKTIEREIAADRLRADRSRRRVLIHASDLADWEWRRRQRPPEPPSGRDDRRSPKDQSRR